MTQALSDGTQGGGGGGGWGCYTIEEGRFSVRGGQFFSG